MKFGYVRVSTKEQNIDRQLVEMYAQGLTDKTIFIDKQSGKNFERDEYQKLKKKQKEASSRRNKNSKRKRQTFRYTETNIAR